MYVIVFPVCEIVEALKVLLIDRLIGSMLTYSLLFFHFTFFTGDDPDEISSSGTEDNVDMHSFDVAFKGTCAIFRYSSCYITKCKHLFNGPVFGTITGELLP